MSYDPFSDFIAQTAPTITDPAVQRALTLESTSLIQKQHCLVCDSPDTTTLPAMWKTMGQYHHWVDVCANGECRCVGRALQVLDMIRTRMMPCDAPAFAHEAPGCTDTPVMAPYVMQWSRSLEEPLVRTFGRDNSRLYVITGTGITDAQTRTALNMSVRAVALPDWYPDELRKLFLLRGE